MLGKKCKKWKSVKRWGAKIYCQLAPHGSKMAPNCSKITPNGSKWLWLKQMAMALVQHCLKWSQMVPIGLQLSTMIQHSKKWSNMLQECPKWSQRVKNGPKIFNMVLNGLQWYQMVLNGLYNQVQPGSCMVLNSPNFD